MRKKDFEKWKQAFFPDVDISSDALIRLSDDLALHYGSIDPDEAVSILADAMFPPGPPFTSSNN